MLTSRHAGSPWLAKELLSFLIFSRSICTFRCGTLMQSDEQSQYFKGVLAADQIIIFCRKCDGTHSDFIWGLIIERERQKRFISAGQIINHCRCLSVFAGVCASCSVLSGIDCRPSASGSRMLLVVLAQRVFGKVIIIYCSPQVFLPKEWRSSDHETECG